LRLAADDQPHHGPPGVPRVAGGHAFGPDYVGGRLQPRRRDLRRHGLDPRGARRGPRREGPPRRPHRGPRRPHRPPGPPRERPVSLPPAQRPPRDLASSLEAVTERTPLTSSLARPCLGLAHGSTKR